MYEITTIFLTFLVYSMLGFISEIIFCSFNDKKLILNRGFLLGPYIPIYGVCCSVLVTSLDKYKNDLIVLLIMSMVVCSFIEYITSYIMEKLFKVRWWDYSEKKYNINGRVCLENAILFGFAGLIIVKFVHPLILDIIYLFPTNIFFIVVTIFFIIFLADFVLTTITMFQLKLDKKKFEKRDSTQEIKMILRKKFTKNTVLKTRILNAFPNLEKFNRNEIQDFKEYLEERKREWKKYKKVKRINNKK